MLISSFFKRKKDEGEPEGPVVQFVAAEHAIDKERAARDKAAMETEVTAACAHTSFQSPPRVEPSVGGQGSSVDPLAIVTADPVPFDPAIALDPVEEGVIPLREVVDVNALPVTAPAHSTGKSTRSPACAPPKKQASVTIASNSTAPVILQKKRKATAIENGKTKEKANSMEMYCDP